MNKDEIDALIATAIETQGGDDIYAIVHWVIQQYELYLRQQRVNAYLEGLLTYEHEPTAPHNPENPIWNLQVKK